MPTVDQLLAAAARAHKDPPFWILEKDYALGYLLAGMAQVEELHAAWVLKGGTALRKFYFADYRFSEDLDFSALARLPRGSSLLLLTVVSLPLVTGAGPLLNRMIVNRDPQRREAERKTRTLFDRVTSTCYNLS